MIDPLEKLVRSGTELDKELLATVLAGLVWIDKDSGEVRFTPEGTRLPKKLQILAYLLGQKAAKALGLVSEELIAPKELATKLGMGGGPLRGQLSMLKKERLVDTKNGKYYIPNYAIESVKALLQNTRRKEK